MVGRCSEMWNITPLRREREKSWEFPFPNLGLKKVNRHNFVVGER